MSVVAATLGSFQVVKHWLDKPKAAVMTRMDCHHQQC
jgi:hypothetical protein